MDPQLCIKGCGFYGSAANKNLCSKCYDDYIKQIIKNNDAAVVLDSSNSHTPCAGGAIDEVGKSEAIDESKKKVKRRCKCCNKRVGLTGFECRCGNMFCGKHRYPEEHACQVNYKDIARNILAQQNPLCISDKLHYRV